MLLALISLDVEATRTLKVQRPNLTRKPSVTIQPGPVQCVRERLCDLRGCTTFTFCRRSVGLCCEIERVCYFDRFGRRRCRRARVCKSFNDVFGSRDGDFFRLDRDDTACSVENRCFGFPSTGGQCLPVLVCPQIGFSPLPAPVPIPRPVSLPPTSFPVPAPVPVPPQNPKTPKGKNLSQSSHKNK